MVVQSHAPAVKVHQLWWVSGVGGGARGWNADQFGRVDHSLPVRPPSGGVDRGGWGARFVGTLLGPEGTGRPGRCKAAGSGGCLVEGFMLVVPPGMPRGLAVGDVERLSVL